MPLSFQSTSHKEAHYHRPDQGWICGGDCRDCPCYLGPDRKGRCQAGKELDGRRSGQCLPRKVDARWMCTRQDTHGVPPCPQGPLPDGSCCLSVPRCQPKRSLRKKRGIFTFAISIVTLAALILTFSKGSRPHSEPPPALSAGPLSSNHSFIENQCSACHADQRITLSRLTELHASQTLHRAIENGKLCLSCHDTVGGERGQFAFAPHTAPTFDRRWEGRGKSSDFLMVAASALSGKHLRTGDIHCANCHREHHADQQDLTAMSNRQCQICHQNQFTSFSDGHPEFSEVTYPYRRRTGIRFDHYRHYQIHFQDEDGTKRTGAPREYDVTRKHEDSGSCRACHDPEPSGRGMIVLPFETSCAACHEPETRGGAPLPFLALPTLDTVSLNTELAAADPPRSIGTWPEYPSPSLPWPTLQLLSPEGRAAWTRLRENKFDAFNPSLGELLAGLDAESSQKAVQDAEALAWAVKELARDLLQGAASANPSKRVGHDELARRLAASGFEHPELLIAGLPPGLVQAMRSAFSEELLDEKLSRLLREVDAYRKPVKEYPAPVAASPSEPPADPPPDNPPNDTPEDFGDDTGESFGDEPEENPADDTGESFGDEPEENPADDTGESFGDEPEENTADDTGESFGDEPAENTADDTGESFGDEPQEKPADDTGESFGDEPEEKPADDTGESFGDEPPENTADDTGESFGDEPEEKPADDTGESFGDQPEENFGEGQSEEPAEEPVELPDIDPAIWATRGGWSHQNGVVSYRSTGHSDPILKEWLEELSRQVEKPLARAHLAEGFDFRQGSASSMSGKCFKCHSVDEIRDEQNQLAGARINWRNRISAGPRPSLTKYEHATHLLLMDCRSCHFARRGEAAQAYLKAYPEGEDWDDILNWSTKADPSQFHSSFSSIQKRTCASCHNAAKAGDRCTQCHDYHKSSP